MARHWGRMILDASARDKALGGREGALDRHSVQVIQAIRLEDEALLRELLKNPSAARSRNRWGHSALALAAQASTPALAQALLRSGADVDARCAPSRRTPLMAAAWSGRQGSVDILLEAGADPLAVDAQGFDALMCAAQGGWWPCALALADLSDLGATNSQGLRAFELAPAGSRVALELRARAMAFDEVQALGDRALPGRRSGPGAL